MRFCVGFKMRRSVACASLLKPQLRGCCASRQPNPTVHQSSVKLTSTTPTRTVSIAVVRACRTSSSVRGGPGSTAHEGRSAPSTTATSSSFFVFAAGGPREPPGLRDDDIELALFKRGGGSFHP
ncbi:hypothetical protein DFJ73DRAFT_299077 [Zopfochytrium polystomum]|nr:hypothetical protein DFJ73DRAFT_299077 [Zopfochytrium polystomum]